MSNQQNQTEYVTDLLRQVLNEKGMYETVTALLAALPPERKREIAESLLDPNALSYSPAFTQATLAHLEPILKKVAEDMSAQIEGKVREYLASRLPDFVGDAQVRAERKVREAIDKVFEPLPRRW